MKAEKVNSSDAALLVRALGLLINQAGIYGAKHNVTQHAARSVFSELERMLESYREIEFALKDHLLFVNGDTNSIDPVTAKNLSDRLEMQNVPGIAFLSPPDFGEFLICISLLGTPAVSLAAQGGFDEALRRAGIRSIKTVVISFQRVDAEEEKEEEEKKHSPATAPDVLDLSDAFNVGNAGESWGNAGEKGGGSAGGNPEEQKTSHSEKLKAQSCLLASFLLETAKILQSGVTAQELRVKMSLVLDRIRATIEETTADSEQHVSSLADQINEDKQKIDSLENAARRRGIGLNLSRQELIERYAELNQEIVQPLTVSTGVLDLLYSEKSGTITESQRDLLKLASDSIDRVNQLVAYMNRVTGLPDSFSPDSSIIRDSYQ